MSPRNLTIIILLLALLGGVAWFAFGEDDGDVVTPIDTNEEIEAVDKSDRLQGEEANASLDDKRSAVEAVVTDNDEGLDDPFYRKSLAGFRGRVINQDGQPVAKAVVKMAQISPEIIQNPGVFMLDNKVFTPEVKFWDTKTDGEGKFLFEGARPRAWYFIIADATGDNPTSKYVNRAAGPGQVADLGDIKLVQQGVIVGQVVDPDRKPVEGALVRAVDLPKDALALAPLHLLDPRGALIVGQRGTQAEMVVEMPPWAPRYFKLLHEFAHVPMTRTGPDGKFRLTGVMPGSNTLVINKEKLECLTKPGVLVKPGKEKNMRRLKMDEGEIVRGQVVDMEDQPVVGAEVVLAPKSAMIPAHFGSRVGVTDAKGVFECAGFPPGDVVAAVRRDKGEPWKVAGPSSVSADLMIKLPSKFGVIVTLKSQLGRALENPKFKLSPASMRWTNPFDFASLGVMAWVDLDKRLEKLDDGSYRIKDLAAGPYALAVNADGHGAGRANFEIKAGTTRVEVSLPQRVAVTVKVVDPQNKPLRNARVFYMSSPKQYDQRMHEMPLMAGRTNKEGVVVIDDAQVGRLRVTASHPAYGNRHGEAQIPATKNMILTMQAPGAVAGRLTENGQEPTPGKWMVALERRWQSGDRGAMPDMPQLKTPDTAGNFEYTGVRPGKYRVFVVKSSDVVNSPGGVQGYIMEQMMGSSGQRVNVDVVAGQTIQVQIDAIKPTEILTGPTARIRGRVLLNGRPGVGMMVRGWGGRRLTAKVDEQGLFDLGQIKVDEKSKSGWYNLSVQEPAEGNLFQMAMRRSGGLYQTNGQVTEGQDLHLEIAIDTTTAAGMVFDPAGQPMKKARVDANGQRKKESMDGKKKRVRWIRFNAAVETDSDGRFFFKRLPVGSYTFRVNGKGGVGQLSKVELKAALPVTGLQIKTARVYKVTGSLDMSIFEGKKKADGVQVRLRSRKSKGGSGDRWAYVRMKGRSSNRLTFSSVPPGTYDVRAFYGNYSWGRDSKRLVGTQPITVTDRDIKNVVISFREEAPPAPKPKPKPKKKPVKKAG